MRWLTTDNCLWCFSLRTGGLIMGWFGVVASVLLILVNGSDAYRQMLFDRWKQYNMQATPEVLARIDLIQWIFVLAMSGLLLYGIYQKIAWALLPNVILSIITLVLILIGIVATIIICIGALTSNDPNVKNVGFAGLLGLILYLPILALNWHLTAVIYSLYQEIKEGNQHRPGVVYHEGAQRDPHKV